MRIPPISRSGTGGWALAGVAGLIAALAVVFSNAASTQRMADQGVAAQWAEASIGSISTFRATMGLTLVLAENAPESPALPILIDNARLLSGQLGQRLSEGPAVASGPATHPGPAAMLAAAETLLSLLASGDLSGAEEAALGLAQHLDDLTGAYTADRDRLIGAVLEESNQAGRVGTAARFMVALGIPGLTLISWAGLSRRRVRRNHMEAALERERELSRSKDQMIANISHELRTPLTTIHGAALTIAESPFSISQARAADWSIIRELNEMVVQQSSELKRMVEDLLVSAQVGAERLSVALQDVDVVAAARSAADELARTGAHADVSCEPGRVVADPLRLKQVLRNLLSNARRHGGDRIWIAGRPDGDRYLLIVGDDGPGVPGEIEERLFTPYVHQGDRPLVTGSVGLGLSITRILTEAMGGRIEYRRLDGATLFEVALNPAPPDPGGRPMDRLLTGREPGEAATPEVSLPPTVIRHRERVGGWPGG